MKETDIVWELAAWQGRQLPNNYRVLAVISALRQVPLQELRPVGGIEMAF